MNPKEESCSEELGRQPVDSSVPVPRLAALSPQRPGPRGPTEQKERGPNRSL